MDLTNPFLTLTCKLGWMSTHSSSCYRFVIVAKKFYYLFPKKAFEGLGFVHLKILYGGNSPNGHCHKWTALLMDTFTKPHFSVLPY